MGANCCIAAKERPQPSLSSVEVSMYRVRHSPSWSFRWDNRTHIEDIMENNIGFFNHSSGNIQPELKSGSIVSIGGPTGCDDRADVFHRVNWHKSDKKMEASKLSKVDPGGKDQSATKNSPPEVSSHKSLDAVTLASEIKTSESLPLIPLLGSKAEPEDPSSCMNCSDSTGKSCQSPRDRLYRKMTDGNTPSLKTFSANSSAERGPSSSTLLSGSNYLFAGLSHGESSKELCHRPSESVVSSQRDGWLVDNELVGSITSNLSGSSASCPTALSPDQGVCKLCSNLLKERSSWNGYELAVVAVLFCGHAYHANCLDSITAETERYDPSCPVCTHGESCTAKLLGKLESKVKNKTLKIMSNSDLDRSSKHQKKSVIGHRLGISSSMKEPFRKPFLRRHFSTGSRPPRLVLGSEPTRKKGFWSGHWRENSKLESSRRWTRIECLIDFM